MECTKNTAKTRAAKGFDAGGVGNCSAAVREMRNLKLVSGALGVAAAGAFGLALVCGLFFYTFYLKWAALFENHRYFDPQSGIVYHDSSSVHGILAALFLLISASCLLLRQKLTKGKIN